MKKKTKGSYWMVKQEPETYSWSDFVTDGVTDWSGVRNYQARNNLKAMKKGDRALFYHSGKTPEVVGIAEVTKPAYPDPTIDDDRWVVVDFKPIEEFAQRVSLASIRENPALEELSLLRQTQLSVVANWVEELKRGSLRQNKPE